MIEYTSEQKALIERLKADRLRNHFSFRPKMLSDKQMAVSVAGRIFEMQREITEYEKAWAERDKYQDTLSELIESLKGQCQILEVVQKALEIGQVDTDDLINNKSLFLSQFHEMEVDELQEVEEDEDVVEKIMNSQIHQLEISRGLQEQIKKIYEILGVFAEKLNDALGVNLDIPKQEKKPHLESVKDPDLEN